MGEIKLRTLETSRGNRLSGDKGFTNIEGSDYICRRIEASNDQNRIGGGNIFESLEDGETFFRIDEVKGLGSTTELNPDPAPSVEHIEDFDSGNDLGELRGAPLWNLVESLC